MRKKRLLICTSSLLAIFIVLFSVCAVYVSDYYHADTEKISAFSYTKTIEVRADNGTISYIPENAIAGLIFYPGGKVEHTAYDPLMKALSEKGFLCVLVEMPFNLAVLDMNAADGIKEIYPNIESWYIGGHSLGGSMAASYVSQNTDDFQGLILLGSYSTADLSGTDIKALSIYGSEDKVINLSKYNECKGNLPKDLTEFVIDGGCHAYFGMYGPQDGDGTPSISNTEQIQITANKIAELVEMK